MNYYQKYTKYKKKYLLLYNAIENNQHGGDKCDALIKSGYIKKELNIDASIIYCIGDIQGDYCVFLKCLYMAGIISNVTDHITDINTITWLENAKDNCVIQVGDFLSGGGKTNVAEKKCNIGPFNYMLKIYKSYEKNNKGVLLNTFLDGIKNKDQNIINFIENYSKQKMYPKKGENIKNTITNKKYNNKKAFRKYIELNELDYKNINKNEDYKKFEAYVTYFISRTDCINEYNKNRKQCTNSHKIIELIKYLNKFATEKNYTGRIYVITGNGDVKGILINDKGQDINDKLSKAYLENEFDTIELEKAFKLNSNIRDFIGCYTKPIITVNNNLVISHGGIIIEFIEKLVNNKLNVLFGSKKTINNDDTLDMLDIDIVVAILSYTISKPLDYITLKNIKRQISGLILTDITNNESWNATILTTIKNIKLNIMDNNTKNLLLYIAYNILNNDFSVRPQIIEKLEPLILYLKGYPSPKNIYDQYKPLFEYYNTIIKNYILTGKNIANREWLEEDKNNKNRGVNPMWNKELGVLTDCDKLNLLGYNGMIIGHVPQKNNGITSICNNTLHKIDVSMNARGGKQNPQILKLTINKDNISDPYNIDHISYNNN